MSSRLPKRDPNAAIGAIARAANSAAKDAPSGDVRVSYEFFPPKSGEMEERLWDAIQKLEPLNPDFVSVTYGAGGSTRERTHNAVSRMVKETSFKPAAHLTCVGSTRAEVDEIVQGYWDVGVRHIVALRGDPQDGITAKYEPTENGYAYSSDLVAGIKQIADFEVSVGGYPELHPESSDWRVEIDNLKRKVDAGADRVITQFFFSPDVFWRYKDRVLDAGIDIPIIPGLMLQPNFKGLARMSKMCGVSVPDWYAELFEGLEKDAKTRELLTATLAAELTAELHDRNIRDFHLYTLNKAELAMAVSRILGLHHRKSVAA